MIDEEILTLCRWCCGRGWIAVETNSTLRYRCADCNGTGRIEINIQDEQ